MGTLPEDVRTIMVISGLIRLRMRHMLQKFCIGNQTRILCSLIPPLNLAV